MPVPKELAQALREFLGKQKKGNKTVLVQVTTLGEVFTGYCVKCKANTEIAGSVLVISEKGPPMIKGDCYKCNTGMARIAPKRVYERWTKGSSNA